MRRVRVTKQRLYFKERKRKNIRNQEKSDKTVNKHSEVKRQHREK
jgi:hypothetical protein